MLASFPPFFDDEPIETYRKIIKCRLKFPRYFSQEAKDLIKSLLRAKPTKRLGVLRGNCFVFLTLSSFCEVVPRIFVTISGTRTLVGRRLRSSKCKFQSRSLSRIRKILVILIKLHQKRRMQNQSRKRKISMTIFNYVRGAFIYRLSLVRRDE